MTIYSTAKMEEKREEAIRLLTTAIQFPVAIPTQHVEDVAKQVVKAADVLLNYILSGKTD